MASAFNICALVVHWRVEIPPGLGANEGHGLDVRDPIWYSTLFLCVGPQAYYCELFLKDLSEQDLSGIDR